MRMYAWIPKGHGAYSFFVMAKRFEEAKAAVLKSIEDRKMDDYESGKRLQEKFSDGTSRYDIIVCEEGEVAINGNE